MNHVRSDLILIQNNNTSLKIKQNNKKLLITAGSTPANIHQGKQNSRKIPNLIRAN